MSAPSQPAQNSCPCGCEHIGTEAGLSWIPVAEPTRVIRRWKPYLIKVREVDPFPMALTEEQYRRWVEYTPFGFEYAHFRPGEEMRQYITTVRSEDTEGINVDYIPDWDTIHIPARETPELDTIKSVSDAARPSKARKKISIAEYQARKAAKAALAAAGQSSGDSSTPLEAVSMSASTSSQSIMSSQSVMSGNMTANDTKPVIDAVPKKDPANAETLHAMVETQGKPTKQSPKDATPVVDKVPKENTVNGGNAKVTIEKKTAKPATPAASDTKAAVDTVTKKNTANGGNAKTTIGMEAKPAHQAAKDTKAVVETMTKKNTTNGDHPKAPIEKVTKPATKSAKDRATALDTATKNGTAIGDKSNDTIEKAAKPSAQPVKDVRAVLDTATTSDTAIGGKSNPEQPGSRNPRLEKLGRPLSPGLPPPLQSKVDQFRKTDKVTQQRLQSQVGAIAPFECPPSPLSPVKLNYGQSNATEVQRVLSKEPAAVKKPEAIGAPKAKEKEPAKADQASQRKANASQLKGKETAPGGKSADNGKLKVESGKSLGDNNGKKKGTTASGEKGQMKDPKAGDKRPLAADDEERRVDRSFKRQKTPDTDKTSKGVPEKKDAKTGVKRPRAGEDERPTEPALKKQKMPEEAEVKKEPRAGDKRARAAVEDERPSERAVKKQKQPERLEATTNRKGGTPISSSSNVSSSQKSASTLTAPANKDVKSTAGMRRVGSSDSHVATPQGVKNDAVTSTAQAPTSGGTGSRPTSAGGSIGTNNMSRDEFIKSKRAEFVKYNDLGRIIKRQAEDTLNRQAARVAGSISGEGAALGVQSVCCYIMAFHADDCIRQGGQQEVNNWRSLVPFWEFVERSCRPFTPLHGICLQLGAIIREVIQGLDATDAANATHMRRLWLEGTAKLTADDIQKSFPRTWSRRAKNPFHVSNNKRNFFLPLSSCITTPLQAVYAANSMVNEWARAELRMVRWDWNRLGI